MQTNANALGVKRVRGCAIRGFNWPDGKKKKTKQEIRSDTLAPRIR